MNVQKKKTCVITFLDENEAPRITDPTDIELTIYIYIYKSDCATMITYSDVEIESYQLTGGSCSCVPRVVLEYNIKRETWVHSKLGIDA